MTPRVSSLELAQSIARYCGLSVDQTYFTINALVKEIILRIGTGQSVRLSGLGMIKLYQRPEYERFDFHSKTKKVYPPTTCIKFLPSQETRDALKSVDYIVEDDG